VEGYVIDGYEAICRAVPCIFDQVMYTNEPRQGNHTRIFEEQFMDGPILGLFNFTRESEREFVGPDSEGPVNHTRPSDAEHMDTPSTRVIAKLPPDFVEVDRVTHDWLRLEGAHARQLRDTRTDYETMQGGVFAYSMDQDGLFSIRTVSVPVTELPTVEISGLYGGIRQVDGFDDEPVVGTYGGIRLLPIHFMSGQSGGMKRIIDDDKATRVELFRLGRSLESEPFEVPDRVVRYIEWWAMYRAFSDDTDGEDKALAEHYKNRYQRGVALLERRVNAIMDERTRTIGGKRQGMVDRYLQRFPSDYGYPRGYRS
jgi:hypothetical protein